MSKNGSSISGGNSRDVPVRKGDNGVPANARAVDVNATDNTALVHAIVDVVGGLS
jgi:hypothetical protein